ncbi:hypothetical protein C8Q73DRAFT_108981 [Cubamyces lactineus]|nr:hypothetical protein C8Q73DRAFT_108981 [Cubamyces lactineus]
MSASFNAASVILRRYPEYSPWEIDRAVYLVWPFEYTPCHPFPASLKDAALAHAQETKLNPLHFMCGSNPFALSGAAPEEDMLLLPSIPTADAEVSSLPRNRDIEDALIIPVEELCVTSECAVYRVRIGEELKVLKLYLGPTASARFDAETAAYARFLHHDTAATGAVLHCYGWVQIDVRAFKDATAPTVISAQCQDVLSAHGLAIARGIVLEDISGAEFLSIHNVSPALAPEILRSLYNVHTAYVLHGAPDLRRCVLVRPTQKQATWIDFSNATCVNGSASLTRNALLAELAEAWCLVFQRLIPDSMIGWDAGPDAIDPRTLTGTTVRAIALSPSCPRPSSFTVEEEFRTILSGYPEIDIFSWDPPISNLSPARRYDHQFDTDEFLRKVQAARYDTQGYRNPLFKWYGECPLYPSPYIVLGTVLRNTYLHYVPPPQLRQLPSETDIEFLEHVWPLNNHPLFMVRVGTEKWLMKIFSKERRPGHRDDKTEKERFELERDAYAHLVHYGACDARIVPQCSGWLELSPAHIYDALAMIRRTRATGTFEEGEQPPSISPIFEDGSCACALLIEYIPNGTPISQENLTMERMDLVLRTISRLHGAYVGHGDIHSWSNVLLVRERSKSGEQPERERVVLIDFDRAATPQSTVPVKPNHLLRELSTVWTKFYTAVLPNQRLHCAEPKHPHAVDG